MKSGRLCKAESSSSDIISTLPQTILEAILCLLPTKEVARTSILSREWRYKWTNISKLEFYLSQVIKRVTKEKQLEGKNRDSACKPFDELLQIMLLHQGPIHEFTLHIDPRRPVHDSFGFDQIILHLSKNHTVKKLSLFGYYGHHLRNIPISFFSLHHLTDLVLSLFELDHQPIFNGFGTLRSLFLNVKMSTKTLLHLLSHCPALKILTLAGESHLGDRDCNIIELFECLHVIEHLTLFGYVTEWVDLDSAPQVLPTLLFHLKYFCFQYMCSFDGYGFAFLLILIKCSPNLEKIKLQIDWDHDCHGIYSVVWEEYSDVCLEQLIELEIERFSNLKPEMEFVKFVLARSPNLKKVSIRSVVETDQEQVEMLKILLQAPRTSTVIITVK